MGQEIQISTYFPYMLGFFLDNFQLGVDQLFHYGKTPTFFFNINKSLKNWRHKPYGLKSGTQSHEETSD